MNSIKLSIKIFLSYIIDLILKPSKIIGPNSILLLRIDAIGDYVVFRNFIEVLSKSKKYTNYKITMVGNVAWKSLAEEFDSEFVEQFIWIDTVRFTREPFYRYQMLNKITSKGYSFVINSTYSRYFLLDDAIVKNTFADKKIGSIGDLSNLKQWQKNISDKYYHQLIPAKNDIIFEFYRHKEFFSTLLEENINLDRPEIQLKKKELSIPNIESKYAILFIGASKHFRKWPIEKFVKIGEYLKNKYGYSIVLCGAPSDLNDSTKFKNLAAYKYVDLVGKTSLIDLMYIIKNGNLMITNETSAPHFAVALKMKNIFVIYNGNHFKRFTPYPPEICDSYYPVYHPEIEKDLEKYKYISNSYGYESQLDIGQISTTQVKKKLLELLH